MTMRLPRTGAGSAKLTLIRDGLSARDHEILTFLSRHRYATTTQLRDVFFADHATPTAGTRACVRVLHRNLRDRVVARLERRVGGVNRGSAASIWYLDAPGERLTRTDGGTRRRFATVSSPFLEHTLAVVDTHVQLIHLARAGVFTIESVEIETEAWRPYLTAAGATSVLKPDLHAHLATTDYDDHWYIEVDRGTESIPVLLTKCRAYAAYRATGRAQTEHGVFPRVLWVLPAQGRQARLETAVQADPRLDKRLFKFTTTSGLSDALSDEDDAPSTEQPEGGTQ